MILNDKQIEELCYDGMIEPWRCGLARKSIAGRGILSYGLGSYGYDIRLSPKEFRVFKRLPGMIVDVKAFSDVNLEQVALLYDNSGGPADGSAYFILPAHSYGLGVSLERIKMPKDVTALCIGKSTYARCFSGDTKVKLVDGDYSFTELIERANAGERLYGFGVLDGRIVIQELVSPRFIDNSALLEVALDNGELIRCTPDHKFLLKNGGEVEARHLESGDSLHAIYEWDDHGYPGVYDPVFAARLGSSGRDRRGARSSVHRMVARDILGKSEGFDVHHLDGNKRNNHPSNLECISASEHARIHNRESLRHLLGGQASAEKFATDPEHRQKILSILHSDENKQKAAEARRPYLHSSENHKRLSIARQARWQQEGAKERQSLVARNGVGALRRRDDITHEALVNALLATGSVRGAARVLDVDRSAFRRFPHILQRFKEGRLAENHKVKQVSPVPGKHPTYCLTAPRTGNFALSAGVFVKNCGIIANTTPIEAGWEGHITLEFSNSSDADCRIYAYEGVCQLLFFRGEPCLTSYSCRSGKYQNQEDRVTLPRV